MQNSERNPPDEDHRPKSRVVEIEFEFGRPDHSELGAIVLSHLLIPVAAALSEADRTRYQDVLRGYLLGLHAEDDPEWSGHAQSIAPADLRRSPKEIAKVVRTLDRRLRDRALTGYLALRYAWEVDPEGFADFQPKVKRPSKNALAANLGGQAIVKRDGKSIERLLREGRPVLHLCAAYAHIRQARARLKCSTPWITGFWDGGFLRNLLGAARHFEGILPASRIGVSTDDLVKFRGKNGDKNLQTS